MFESRVLTKISRTSRDIASSAKPALLGVVMGIVPLVGGILAGLLGVGIVNYQTEKSEGLREQIEQKKTEMVADGFSKQDLGNFKYSLFRLPTGGNRTTLSNLESLHSDSKYSGIKSRAADSLSIHKVRPTWTADRVSQQVKYLWR